MNLLPLLPFMIPLLGAWLLWVWPRKRFTQIERWLVLAILWLIPLALSLVVGRSFALPLGWSALESVFWDEPFLLRYDRLAAILALGYAMPLVLAESGRPLQRSRTMVAFGLLLLGMLSCIAGNLLSLCLAWGAVDLFIPFLMRHTAVGQIERRTARVSFMGLLSTMALMVGMTLLAIHQGQTQFDPVTASPAVMLWLSIAVLLRLGPWPVQANYTSLSLTHLSLYMGGSLWLRVAPGLAATTLLQLASFGSMTLLVSALLALVASERRLPYLFLPGTAMVVLAPLCGTELGLGVALLALINMGLAAGLWQLVPSLEAVLPARWARWPLALFLASLGGFPLTLGMVTHLGLYVGYRSLATPAWIMVVLSLVLLATALWRQWNDVHYPERTSPDSSVERWLWLGSGALLAAPLLLLGLMPGIVAVDGMTVPSLGQMVTQRGALSALLAAVALPCGLGYLLARSFGKPASVWGSLLRWLGTVFELDWLYVGIESGLARLGKWATYAVVQIEGPLAFGWALLWGLPLVLLLLEGG